MESLFLLNVQRTVVLGFTITKQFYSIVMFAIDDGDYIPLHTDVGRNWRISDGGIFANTPYY